MRQRSIERSGIIENVFQLEVSEVDGVRRQSDTSGKPIGCLQIVNGNTPVTDFSFAFEYWCSQGSGDAVIAGNRSSNAGENIIKEWFADPQVCVLEPAGDIEWHRPTGAVIRSVEVDDPVSMAIDKEVDDELSVVSIPYVTSGNISYKEFVNR